MTRPRLKQYSILDELIGTKRQIKKQSNRDIIQFLENLPLDGVLFFDKLGYEKRDIQYSVRHYSTYMMASRREFMIKTVNGGWKVWRWK